MARSKAAKTRKKRVREGRLDPELMRSPYAELDLRTRKTKNKKDLIYKIKHKNRPLQQRDNDSFFIVICTNLNAW
ncbi:MULTISPECIES: hypothetical protein [unclassified Virgibacillus]|uniref:hypothetical protein n=1 Tax=unclassified Virgibacillus TaxID=2620237 RepID=UPI0024DE071E|nr:hypothetical protein [Virgibacillus sp. LDC-1]